MIHIANKVLVVCANCCSNQAGRSNKKQAPNLKSEITYRYLVSYLVYMCVYMWYNKVFWCFLFFCLSLLLLLWLLSAVAREVLNAVEQRSMLLRRNSARTTVTYWYIHVIWNSKPCLQTLLLATRDARRVHMLSTYVLWWRGWKNIILLSLVSSRF